MWKTCGKQTKFLKMWKTTKCKGFHNIYNYENKSNEIELFMYLFTKCEKNINNTFLWL